MQDITSSIKNFRICNTDSEELFDTENCEIYKSLIIKIVKWQ